MWAGYNVALLLRLRWCSAIATLALAGICRSAKATFSTLQYGRSGTYGSGGAHTGVCRQDLYPEPLTSGQEDAVGNFTRGQHISVVL